jgi:sugar phosphate permease
VTGDVWNLVAAVLCTIGALIVTVAAFLSELTTVNILAAIGAAIGTAGGMAWIIAASMTLRRRR